MASALDIKNCTFTFEDGAAHTLEFKIGDGGLSFRLRRNIEFKKNRGRLDLVKIGDEIPVEVTFDVILEDIKSVSGDPVTPYEFLTQRYAASGYTTVGQTCEPYAIDIAIVNDHNNCGDEEDETITLPEFRVDKIDGGIKDAVLKVTGRCNAALATVVRS